MATFNQQNQTVYGGQNNAETINQVQYRTEGITLEAAREQLDEVIDVACAEDSQLDQLGRDELIAARQDLETGDTATARRRLERARAWLADSVGLATLAATVGQIAGGLSG
ncbi:hypothetical protein ACH4S9_36515 [Streptomyces sp. NPDC021225]|uniref:hypothetical protein n=1 Tax=Streptomyces sp. NPDC021225 TaxID=3365121 RepID=UPI003799B545